MGEWDDGADWLGWSGSPWVPADYRNNSVSGALSVLHSEAFGLFGRSSSVGWMCERCWTPQLAGLRCPRVGRIRTFERRH